MPERYKYEANHMNLDLNDPVQVYRPEVYGEWGENYRKRALIAHTEAVNKLLEFECGTSGREEKVGEKRKPCPTTLKRSMYGGAK